MSRDLCNILVESILPVARGLELGPFEPKLFKVLLNPNSSVILQYFLQKIFVFSQKCNAFSQHLHIQVIFL